MPKTKVTYILSNIDKAIAFEWISEKLDDKKIKLSFILLNDKSPYLLDWLKQRNIESYYIPHFGKKSYPKSFFKLLFILKKINPQIVHTHLLDANLIGLSAAKLLGIKKRIYTRHHSTFHHIYFPKSVKWDRITNSLATHVVAISENVKKVLVERENVPLGKISFIHHGFNLGGFSSVTDDEIKQYKLKYGIGSTNSPVIGVIARYVKLKGIQYTIVAFKQLLVDFPDAKLVLANAVGPDKDYIKAILKKQLKPNQYIEILFEPNLFVLYKLFDVYVHVPINEHIEAFGQTYVEALAAGIPSVFSLSGVATEFIKDGENALVVNYENSSDIYTAIKKILEKADLKMKLVENGKKSIAVFELDIFISKLEKLYA